MSIQKNHLYAFLIIILFQTFSSYAQNVSVQNFYNVKQYGAAGDGNTLDGKAINAAIEAASAAGGGTVYFSAGNYLSGSIRLKSNIHLLIDAGATLIAAPVSAANGYDEEEQSANTTYQDAGHSHFHNSFIWGEHLHDVSITGGGTIWGKGLYKDYVKDKQSANKAIALLLCKNVIIRDITFLHGGWFAILATGVDNLTIDNLKMDTNRDGMDVDCCRNVRICNCSVNSPYDDGICLKSTYALGFARATENVTITNCEVSGFDEGSFLDGTFQRTENAQYKTHPTGRIKFGTESNGGFKNITVSNCVFDYCRGFALETVDGGLLEDVTITNITMRDVVNDPFFLRLGARMRGPKETPVGELRRIVISNVMVYNANLVSAFTISGVPDHPVKDITLSNIHIYYKGGGSKALVTDTVPEKADQYPEPGMFGASPSYGLYVRHAENVKIDHVHFYLLGDDARPAFVFDDVKGATIEMTASDKTNAHQFVFKRSSAIHVYNSGGEKDKLIDKADALEVK